jgi:hypothetical protein
MLSDVKIVHRLHKGVDSGILEFAFEETADEFFTAAKG